MHKHAKAKHQCKVSVFETTFETVSGADCYPPTYIKYLCVTDNASTDRPQKDQLMSATYTTQLQDQHLHAQAPSTECVL